MNFSPVLMLFFLIFLTNSSAFAEDSILAGQDSAIKGKVLKEVPFTDQNSKKVLVLSKSGLYKSHPDATNPDYTCGNADIYAYCFDISRSGQPVLLWQIKDFIHDCDSSATAEFTVDSPVITDLDKNGISEVWITYYVGCHGDVSPDGMKIIMYEGNKKYALRGETYVNVDNLQVGGKYTTDQAFGSAPDVFRRFADQLWQKNKQR